MDEKQIVEWLEAILKDRCSLTTIDGTIFMVTERGVIAGTGATLALLEQDVQARLANATAGANL